VLIENGRFEKIGPASQVIKETSDRVIDAKGSYLAPGFIDLHMHGTGRYLTDNGPEDLTGLCNLLPQYGVTSFLPGVCPRPKGDDAEFLGKLSKVSSKGSRILGFHLEGPFLSITGALPPEALGVADPGRVEALIEAAKPYRVIFSVSPEFNGILELLPIMSRSNTPVFAAHTKANVQQTQLAIEAGVSHATHFYDVFYAPDETEPGVRPCGVVEAILADERVSVDFILDGEHVDPVAVQMALKCKGHDKVCLITDANVGAGLPPGRYDFVTGEVEFRYPGGPARLTESSGFPGCLAGSGLTMDLAVRNAISMLNIGLPLAIRMASANPARVLRLENQKGHVEEGFDADFVLMNEDLTVEQTWIGGNCVYNKNK
jgi:N-acetylglucosamine-6-phosphate deacetylase